MSDQAKDLRALERRFRGIGGVVRQAGSGHLKWRLPGWPGFVTSSQTPSCRHAANNIRRDLRRIFGIRL